MTVQEDGDGADAIEISDEWWDKLTAMPFISRKYNKCFNSAVYYRLRNHVMTLDGPLITWDGHHS